MRGRTAAVTPTAIVTTPKTHTPVRREINLWASLCAEPPLLEPQFNKFLTNASGLSCLSARNLPLVQAARSSPPGVSEICPSPYFSRFAFSGAIFFCMFCTNSPTAKSAGASRADRQLPGAPLINRTLGRFWSLPRGTPREVSTTFQASARGRSEPKLQASASTAKSTPTAASRSLSQKLNADRAAFYFSRQSATQAARAASFSSARQEPS